MKKYAHSQDCWIERDLEGHPNSAVVMDCDGWVVHTFPEEWKDEQIWYAIQFANTTYNYGYEAGKRHMAADIRNLLGCVGKEEVRSYAD